jgi:hypothetical protein
LYLARTKIADCLNLPLASNSFGRRWSINRGMRPTAVIGAPASLNGVPQAAKFVLKHRICFDGDAMPDPLEPAPHRTIVRHATWLVAWDEAAQSHFYRRDVDLVIAGETIAAIGPPGAPVHSDAVEIDGRDFAILPGFIDIHAHPSSEPMLKGLRWGPLRTRGDSEKRG